MQELDPADDLTLLDLLDRVVAKGVIIQGDLTISVANIDLLYITLRVLISSVSRIEDVTGQRFGMRAIGQPDNSEFLSTE